jgi:hypothetical protein
MFSMEWVICLLPRACSWLERSTCLVIDFIYSADFMICSLPLASSAVDLAICCTV